MVGKLLIRGMLAGIAAGLLTFSFAKVVGEPQVDRAIALEEHADAAKDEAPEPEIVSRATQASYGLFAGVMVYGASVGGIFALVFAYARGRTGRLSARALCAWIALAAFVALVIVPNIKYPANPPSVGDHETIGYRTGLFFLMIAISLAVTVFSLKVRGALARKWGGWNGSIAALVLFVVVIGAIQAALPGIDEVPAAFPAVLLWKFRTAAIGMQAILWTAIGLVFGALVERLELSMAREGSLSAHGA
ncbi:CbtA family protein [Paraburkholderia tagetis]|uniref:CbtA family protein n=1 Tax=Paraburkholderia tagetis TaxID=2913261 RepID=A0A9X1RS56_9BURK|nr:CbtA family protein [Paraburkholderia tagetis]MCG5073999.1 CbtA family protein [Paraburkholderia tagetis]